MDKLSDKIFVNKERRSNSESDKSSDPFETDDSMREQSKASCDGEQGVKREDKANEEYLAVIHVDGPLGALVAQAQATRKRVYKDLQGIAKKAHASKHKTKKAKSNTELMIFKKIEEEF